MCVYYRGQVAALTAISVQGAELPLSSQPESGGRAHLHSRKLLLAADRTQEFVEPGDSLRPGVGGSSGIVGGPGVVVEGVSHALV